MEKDPSLYQDAARTVADDRLGAEGMEAQVRLEQGGTHVGGGRVGWPIPRADGPGGHPQLDDFVSAAPDYNEEEEEQKYFRRQRLCIVKNVLAASLAGTLIYGVYLGTALPLLVTPPHPPRGSSG